MTLKVTIQPTAACTSLYPTYFIYDDGLKIGPAGELVLVSGRREDGTATEFRVYAPDTWKEINVEEVND